MMLERQWGIKLELKTKQKFWKINYKTNPMTIIKISFKTQIENLTSNNLWHINKFFKENKDILWEDY